MKNSLCKVLLSVALVGCGGSTSDTSLGGGLPLPSNAATSDLQGRLQQANLDNPEPALRLVPTEHLNPRRGGGTVFTVDQLESDYETIFGSLNDSLGVTLTTPQVLSDINFIAAQPGTGHFDLNRKPILNNGLGVTGVAFESLEYDTTVPLPSGNQTFHVSGGLLLPQGIGKGQLRGVLVYFHGTTFDKSQVPSNYSNSVEAQLMAQVFASQGYVVVMPDYVGQGVDWQDVHPYVLYPKVSAQTATDMLSAVRPRIAARYGIVAGDPALKLFSVGYSEGGAYSLWFNQYLSSNPALLSSFYRLTHSVGIEGAYNTSVITYNYLFDNVGPGNGNPYNVQSQSLVNEVKPILSADAFLSYAAYSAASDFVSVFNENFFNMRATPPVPQAACNVAGQQVTIADAFARANTNIAGQVLFSGLGKIANGSNYPGPLALFSSSGNSINALVSSNLLKPAFMNQLLGVLQAADLDLSAVANGGVSIVTLDQDSVVVPNNFDDLLNRFPGKIKNSYKVDHTRLQTLSPYSQLLGTPLFQPIDHLQGLIYEYLYALDTFNNS